MTWDRKEVLRMMKRLGIVMGCLFLMGGVMGFVPGVTKDDMFLGVFMVNTAHNVMHLVTGALFILVSLAGGARIGFQGIGLLYAVLAAVGFKVGEGKIFGLISNSWVDAWGHAGLAAVMLLIGFATWNGKRERKMA